MNKLTNLKFGTFVVAVNAGRSVPAAIRRRIPPRRLRRPTVPSLLIPIRQPAISHLFRAPRYRPRPNRPPRTTRPIPALRPTTCPPTRRTTPPITPTTPPRINNPSRLPNRRRRFRNTISRRAPATAITGRPAIGATIRVVATTGFPAPGFWRRGWMLSGRRLTGITRAVTTSGMPDIGDRTLVSTVASTTASDIQAAATTARIGIRVRSGITAK